MPTVVKGAPVASCIPPHENRAKQRVAPDENPAESLRRVVPDENQAESLRRVVPDENQAESLCASLLIRIAEASPRCSARYENREPPRPYSKPYRQAGLQARTIHRKRYLRIFRANVIAVGRQTISLGEKCARKADRRKQTAKITQKTEVYIFILPHQSRKSNGTECKYAICLHSRPSRKAKHCCLATHIAFIAFTTKNFTPKKLLKNVDIMTMTFVSLSVTQFLN